METYDAILCCVCYIIVRRAGLFKAQADWFAAARQAGPVEKVVALVGGSGSLLSLTLT